MLLKTNFHLHTNDDPKDSAVKYSFFEAIDRAAQLGFNAVALTCHHKFIWKEEYRSYAEKKNILLIPGIEINIEKKHVVILNPDKTAENIKTFEDLRKYKTEKPDILIIAPHPFFQKKYSLREKLIENIDLFDALEIFAYTIGPFNFNKKTKELAAKFNLPLIGDSDTHLLEVLDVEYSIIDSEEKNIGAIFKAIKEKKIKVVLNNLSFFRTLFLFLKFYL